MLLAAVLAAPALAAQQPDAAAADSGRPVRLPPIEVGITRDPEPLRLAPVAVDVVPADALGGTRLTQGLDDALALVPGVHVADRENYSLDQRLSIRGFGSRAAFGTRGVRILLDGVPQTLPDGQSQLTNVEFAALDRIEVLRGAASALYGNAAGGVVALRSAAPGTAGFAQTLRVEGGAFGTLKGYARTSARAGTAAGAVEVSRLVTDGFRDHSAAELRQLTARGVLALGAATELHARVALADQPRADNPGALTFDEYAARPEAAAPRNLELDAGKRVDQQQLAVGVRHTGRRSEAAVTVWGLLRDLDNPLATGTTIALDRRVGGLRADAAHTLGGGAGAPRVALGLDLQTMRDDRVNRLAEDDALTVDQRERVTELAPSAQVRWSPVPAVQLQAGGRYDRLRFSVTDRLTGDGDGGGERTLSAWSGLVGVSVQVAAALVAYANVGTAFESPTTTELANRPDGSAGFNPDLDPQRATSWELGVRVAAAGIEGSGAVFLGRVRDAIVQFQEVGGRAFFRNAGRVEQDGVELGLAARLLPWLTLRAAYTWTDYRFAEYRVPDDGGELVLDGNRLPGVPEHAAEFEVRAEPGAWIVAVDHELGSALYADDRNRERVPGWGAGVTGLRLGWNGRAGPVSVLPFVAVRNVFDRRYVGSVTVNGFGGRVLEPAPGRYLAAGLELRYATQ